MFQIAPDRETTAGNWRFPAEFPWSNPGTLQAAAIQLKNQLRRWCRIGTMQIMPVWKSLIHLIFRGSSWVWLGLTGISIVFTVRNMSLPGAPHGSSLHPRPGGWARLYREGQSQLLSESSPNSNTLTPPKRCRKVFPGIHTDDIDDICQTDFQVSNFLISDPGNEWKIREFLSPFFVTQIRRRSDSSWWIVPSPL